MLALTLPESLIQLVLWVAVPVCIVFVGLFVYALCYGARAISGKDDALKDRDYPSDIGVRGDADGPVAHDEREHGPY